MRGLALVLATVLLSGAAQAADVTFKDPQKFLDATFDRPNTEKNRHEVQDAVAKMFSKLADKYLAPGQSLNVEVTDIDLAGRLEPTTASDIRIMQSVTWPRLAFTYTVSQDGKVVASGEADIHDFNYLSGFNRGLPGDRLRYERQMLDDWFRKTLPRQAT